MNKNHRVVWSQARNCFVVASEKARAKGKPSTTRTAIATAVAALFLAPGVASARPVCGGTTPVTTALTSSQCYGDQDVTINSNGSIAVTNTNTAVSVSPGAPYTGTFINNGTISVTNTSWAGTAYGVNFNDGIALTGKLTNTGNITVDINTTSTGYGYGINIDGDVAGTLTNSGHITVDVIGDNSAYAYGIHVNNLSGTLNNSGVISATAKADSDSASAYGVYVGGNLSGSLTNSGTISATANVYSSSHAYAYGVYVDNNLSGTLNNSGTISARATNTYSYTAYAYGVYVGSDLSGSLINSGTISATANANTSHAYAYGVYVGNDLSGSLINSGTISATAKVYSDSAGYAYGVYVFGNLSGTLTNSGTISATATNTQSRSPYAYGVYLGGIAAGGKLDNSGTISATATANGNNGSTAYAYGVYVNGTLAGTLTNSGTISANALSNNPTNASGASAYGVYVGGGLSAAGSLINSGTISATANGSYVSAYGVYVNGNLDGILNNSGTIRATATATNEDANAYGVYVVGDLSGSLTNSGTISASAIASTIAYAVGVYVGGNLTGTLTNSGTISATANGSNNAGARAYGVYMNNLDGTLTNSGTIRATGLGGVLDSKVYSIYASGGSGRISNLAGGLLDGQVSASGTIDVSNDGTIDTRLQGSSVGGNYTQGATGVLKIGAVTTGNYGQLNAGGTATLAAGTGIRVTADPAHTLVATNVLANVISSTGVLTMSTIKVQDNILALNFTAADNLANGVDLTAAGTGMTTVAAAVSASGSPGAAGAARVLDSLMGTIGTQPKGISDFLYALGASGTPGEVANNVSQVLPLVSGGLTQVSLGNLHGVNRVVQARMEQNRGLSSGDDFVGNRKGWIKPLGSWADQKDRNGTFGYSARTYGMALGADGELSQVSRLGAAFAYSHSKVDSNSGAQDAGVDSYQAVLYGARSLGGNTEFNWQADYGLNQNKGNRRIALVGLNALSKYSSTSTHVGAGVGRAMVMSERTSFTPSFRADYTTIHDNGYNETRAGALNLAVDGRTTDEFVLAVDGKLAHALSDTSTLVANLGVGYDTQAKESSVTAAFQGGGAAFTTVGIKPSPTLVRGGLGVVINSRNGTEITARYDIEARTGFTGQTASVKLRIPF